MAQNWEIIDFHTHVRPSWLPPLIPANATTAEREALTQRAKKFGDVDLLLKEAGEGDIALQLLSSTVEQLFGPTGPVDAAQVSRVNDYLADLASAHPGKLAALATVDAFSGEAGAREAHRAVTQLGHVGIVIDSYRNELFINADEVRPTLEVAASLKVPVFVHPVSAVNTAALIKAG